MPVLINPSNASEVLPITLREGLREGCHRAVGEPAIVDVSVQVRSRVSSRWRAQPPHRPLRSGKEGRGNDSGATMRLCLAPAG